MFQIFDCNGRAVGRSAGYARHATAEALIKRPGRIRSAIYTALACAPVPENGRRLVWRIQWIEGGRA